MMHATSGISRSLSLPAQLSPPAVVAEAKAADCLHVDVPPRVNSRPAVLATGPWPDKPLPRGLPLAEAMDAAEALRAGGAYGAAARILDDAASRENSSYVLHHARVNLHCLIRDQLDDAGDLGLLRVVALRSPQPGALPDIFLHSTKLTHHVGLAQSAADFLRVVTHPATRQSFIENNGANVLEEISQDMGKHILCGFSEASHLVNKLQLANSNAATLPLALAVLQELNVRSEHANGRLDAPRNPSFAEKTDAELVRCVKGYSETQQQPFYQKMVAAGACVGDVSGRIQQTWGKWALRELEILREKFLQAKPLLAALHDPLIDANTNILEATLDHMRANSLQSLHCDP